MSFAMELKLYDTLTREKRVFTPIDPAREKDHETEADGQRGVPDEHVDRVLEAVTQEQRERRQDGERREVNGLGWADPHAPL